MRALREASAAVLGSASTLLITGTFAPAGGRHKLGNNSLLLQRTAHGGGYGEDGRLSNLSQLQLVGRPFKAQLRNGKSQGSVGFLECLPRDGIDGRQFFSHARCL